MSLLDELESRGVTAEDLEKAASVRLFEKAAAAEGVDLDSLDVAQVEDLYTAFVSNPSDTDTTKEASAMNDEIVDLFEKTAAAEGIDLDDMADAELAELYNHYVENVLPEQVEGEKQASDEEIVFDMFQKTAAAEGLDLNEYNQYELQNMYGHYVENVLPLQMGDKTAAAEVEDATEKLAEAEILGRHMARAYMDEFDKEAEKETMRERAGRYGQKARDAGRYVDSKAKGLGKGIAGLGSKGVGRGGPKTHRALGYGVPTLAAGGLVYGGKKLNDRRKMSKKSSAVDYDDVVDSVALDMLADAGFDI